MEIRNMWTGLAASATLLGVTLVSIDKLYEKGDEENTTIIQGDNSLLYYKPQYVVLDKPKDDPQTPQSPAILNPNAPNFQYVHRYKEMDHCAELVARVQFETGIETVTFRDLKLDGVPDSVKVHKISPQGEPYIEDITDSFFANYSEDQRRAYYRKIIADNLSVYAKRLEEIVEGNRGSIESEREFNYEGNFRLRVKATSENYVFELTTKYTCGDDDVSRINLSTVDFLRVHDSGQIIVEKTEPDQILEDLFRIAAGRILERDLQKAIENFMDAFRTDPFQKYD